MTFREACQWLGLTLPEKHGFRYRRMLSTPRKPAGPPQSAPGDLREDYLCFTDDWQQKADWFITVTSNRLWDPEGAEALAYLRGRGLSDAVIQAHELGYNPASISEQWAEEDIWLPRWIVIPWEISGQYWRIRVRRHDADIKLGVTSKYAQAKRSANGLYRVNSVRDGSIVVITEGEFDALVVLSQAAHLRVSHGLTAVATGGTQNAHLLRWVMRLSIAKQVLVAFDADEAGDEASEWWMEQLGGIARRLRPTQHDVTDMAKAGEDVAAWIEAALIP
jgi:hypothetical protein